MCKNICGACKENADVRLITDVDTLCNMYVGVLADHLEFRVEDVWLVEVRM